MEALEDVVRRSNAVDGSISIEMRCSYVSHEEFEKEYRGEECRSEIRFGMQCLYVIGRSRMDHSPERLYFW